MDNRVSKNQIEAKILPLRKVLLSALKIEIDEAKKYYRAMRNPGLHEILYELPSEATIIRCWDLVLSIMAQGGFTTSSAENSGNSANEADALKVYIIFGMLLYHESNTSFPLEALIRFLCFEAEIRRKKKIPERTILDIRDQAGTYSTWQGSFVERVTNLHRAFVQLANEKV